MANFPPYGNEYYLENVPEAALKAKPQPDPDMTLRVNAGGGWLNGKTYIEYAGGTSGEFTAPTSDAKWSLLTLNVNGNLQIVDGTPSDNPVFPSFPRNRIVIAAAYIQSNTTKLTSENVFDFRPFVSNPVYSHMDLDGKDESNAHPISSITDLQTELDNRVTQDSHDSDLANKADQDGTNEITFTMNKDATGTPSSNVDFAVNRGDEPNVLIRYNEDNDEWEYTDNGTDYYTLKNGEFSASEPTNWDGGTSPSTVHEALDQLASRIAALEV